MALNKQTRRIFVLVHVTFFFEIETSRLEETFFGHNNRHLFTDGVCANYSREKSENDFRKLTDGHLDSRDPVISVGDKSGQKLPSPQPPPLHPQSPLLFFFLRSLQFFASPHYLRAWNRLPLPRQWILDQTLFKLQIIAFNNRRMLPNLLAFLRFWTMSNKPPHIFQGRFPAGNWNSLQASFFVLMLSLPPAWNTPF